MIHIEHGSQEGHSLSWWRARPKLNSTSPSPRGFVPLKFLYCVRKAIAWVSADPSANIGCQTFKLEDIPELPGDAYYLLGAPNWSDSKAQTDHRIFGTIIVCLKEINWDIGKLSATMKRSTNVGIHTDSTLIALCSYAYLAINGDYDWIEICWNRRNVGLGFRSSSSCWGSSDISTDIIIVFFILLLFGGFGSVRRIAFIQGIPFQRFGMSDCCIWQLHLPI